MFLLRALLALLVVASGAAASEETLRIGSKRFTESYVLGEVLLAAVKGKVPAEHRQGLGNTGIVFAALKAGSIDVYPEYAGTVAREILRLEGNPSIADMHRALASQGIGAAVPLGFNNGYALAMRDSEALRLNVRSISDLARHPALRLGLSQEFIGRADGWPGLSQAYGLAALHPTGLDHGIAYEAIAGGKIDLMDIYSTDAKIERFGLRVLDDDKLYFPRYDALLLYRLDLPQRLPEAWRAISALEGRIDQPLMIRMNAAAELEGRSFAAAASLLDKAAPVGAAPVGRRSLGDSLFAADFWPLTRQHLLLVFVSLAASIAIGVPLGVVAARMPAAGQVILAVVGVIQTIPALALLVFLIALTGSIGTAPTLVALSLYALLPIVRNTEAGLRDVAGGMRRAALALGLRPGQSLRHIELPLAVPTLLAGIKTSAVINVGTATIAAFIGAGGYGERIAAGLALNDNAMLLAGAIPAAALALLVQGAFELIERWCNPLAGVKLRA
jgi:osmoprotectant transport system permease protein